MAQKEKKGHFKGYKHQTFKILSVSSTDFNLISNASVELVIELIILNCVKDITYNCSWKLNHSSFRTVTFKCS